MECILEAGKLDLMITGLASHTALHDDINLIAGFTCFARKKTYCLITMMWCSLLVIMYLWI